MTEYPNQPLTGSTSAGQYDQTLTAVFNDRNSAERAYDALENRGYTDKDINLLMSDETRDRHFANPEHDTHGDTDLRNKALEHAGAGSAIGGTVGAVAGAIAAIGTSLIIPGLGLVVAGPLAAGLAGAGAGGLTGGLIGALTGSGVSEDRARAYESSIKQGGIVLTVHPKNAEDADYLRTQGFQ